MRDNTLCWSHNIHRLVTHWQDKSNPMNENQLNLHRKKKSISHLTSPSSGPVQATTKTGQGRRTLFHSSNVVSALPSPSRNLSLHVALLGKLLTSMPLSPPPSSDLSRKN